MIKRSWQKFSVSIELFLLALMGLSLPINGFPLGKKFLGEMSFELAFYPSLLFVLFFWGKVWWESKFDLKKVFDCFVSPLKSEVVFSFLFIFILWILVSGIINLPEISHAYYKGRTGLGKFFLQFLILIYGYVLSITFYNFFRLRMDGGSNQWFHYFERFLILGLVTQLIVGTFEWIHKFTPVKIAWLEALQCFFVVRPICDGLSSRLTFLSGEPSWFAIYVAVVMPFFWSWLLRRPFFIAMLLWLWSQWLVYFTFSRTAYITLTIQAVLNLVLIITRAWRFGGWSKRDRQGMFLSIISILVLLSPLDRWSGWFQNIQSTHFVSRTFESIPSGNALPSKAANNSNELLNHAWQSLSLDKFLDNGSNKTRLTMQLAGFVLGLQNPIFGIGFGQFGFHVEKVLKDSPLLRRMAEENGEIKSYFEPGGLWPHVHGIAARLAAESGLLGLGLWLLIWFLIIAKLIKKVPRTRPQVDAALIATCSIFFVFFVTDYLRFQVLWMDMAIALFIANTAHEHGVNEVT